MLLEFLANAISGLGSLFGGVSSGNRQQYLEDREHTEMREDTAVQRLAEDYRQAGLNPYSISGSTGASSSASQVGENSVLNRLQTLGYILDIGNLSLKNKKLANDQLSTILGFFKKDK